MYETFAAANLKGPALTRRGRGRGGSAPRERLQVKFKLPSLQISQREFKAKGLTGPFAPASATGVAILSGHLINSCRGGRRLGDHDPPARGPGPAADF